MSVPNPVPAPRTNAPLNDAKKPVPLPRRSVVQKPTDVVPSEDPSPSLKERVRSLSTTSKHIKDELAGKVHETKRAAIEGTRESLRRIRKRFTTANIQDHLNSSARKNNSESVVKSASDNNISVANDVFGSIRFKSPIATQPADQGIYNNVNPETESSSDESVSLPPPRHPPPPLPDESVYDQPQSVASGSTGSDTPLPIKNHPYDYESVFPSYPYNSDTDSGTNISCATLESKAELVRSDSWSAYDAVALSDSEENVYDHVGDAVSGTVDNILTPTSCLIQENSLYENHTLIRPSPPVPARKPKARESVLAQFDPISKQNADRSNGNDMNMLENLLEAELCSSVSNVIAYDSWSISNESDSEDYLNPPTPPARFDSLPEDNANKDTTNTKTNWFSVDTATTKPMFSRSNETRRSNNWLRDQFNELKKKVPDSLNLKAKEKCLERPALVAKGPVKQKGMLYKVTARSYEDFFSEFSVRWCVLEGGNFICYSDNTCDTVRESFPLDSILSVQVLLEQKYK